MILENVDYTSSQHIWSTNHVITFSANLAIINKRFSKKIPPCMAIKDTWNRDIRDRAVKVSQELHVGSQIQLPRSNIIKEWAKESWKERWEEYLNTVTPTKNTL